MEILIAFGVIVFGIIAYIVGNKLIKKIQLKQAKGNKK